MSNFWIIIHALIVVALSIFEFGEAAYYFDKKKWAWFGLSAYLAIYWMAWIISHSFS